MNYIEMIPFLDEMIQGQIDGRIAAVTGNRLNAGGENYLSVAIKVDVHVKPKNKKEQIIEMVVKVIPPSDLKPGSRFLSTATFKNELGWYRHVIPTLQAFEKSLGVTGYTDFYPKFYGGRLTLKERHDFVDKDAAIAIEYLRDYENVDRFIGFDLEQSKEILQVLARLHTLSIALKEKDPFTYLKDIKTKTGERFLIPEGYTDTSQGGFKMTEGILEIIEESKEFSDDIINRVKKYLDKDWSKVRPSLDVWGTTTHSDFWVNNIMIRKDSSKDIPPIKIIDFQMVEYQSCALDVVFYLLLSVKNSVIKSHLDELIDFYYDTFIVCLKELKVDTSMFTRAEYMEEIKLSLTDGGQFSHVLGSCSAAFIEEGPDVMVEGNKEVFKRIANSNKSVVLKEKVLHVVRTCVEKNWI